MGGSPTQLHDPTRVDDSAVPLLTPRGGVNCFDISMVILVGVPSILYWIAYSFCMFFVPFLVEYNDCGGVKLTAVKRVDRGILAAFLVLNTLGLTGLIYLIRREIHKPVIFQKLKTRKGLLCIAVLASILFFILLAVLSGEIYPMPLPQSALDCEDAFEADPLSCDCQRAPFLAYAFWLQLLLVGPVGLAFVVIGMLIGILILYTLKACLHGCCPCFFTKVGKAGGSSIQV